MGIRNDIRYRFATLSIAEKLIVVNVLVFILNILIPFLFALHAGVISQWFQLPKDVSEFILQPWSIVTYSFFHGGFSHIFWNMLMLFFAGRMFLNLFSVRRFLNVYFLGIIAGGLTFLLSYNLFPAFSAQNPPLIGASAGVMAILIFVCSYMPNQDVRLIFFNVKLWYIGAFFILLDLVQIPISNAGGHLAHLGGAFIGFLYARKLLEGKDIGSGFEKFTSGIANIFKPNKKSPLKTVHKSNKSKKVHTSVSVPKSIKQKQIDDILDKISKSGYESLSKEEKDFLFKAGKD